MQYISWHENLGHVGEIFVDRIPDKNCYCTDSLDYEYITFIVLHQSFVSNNFTAGIASSCNDNSGRYQNEFLRDW